MRQYWWDVFGIVDCFIEEKHTGVQEITLGFFLIFFAEKWSGKFLYFDEETY